MDVSIIANQTGEYWESIYTYKSQNKNKNEKSIFQSQYVKIQPDLIFKQDESTNKEEVSLQTQEEALDLQCKNLQLENKQEDKEIEEFKKDIVPHVMMGKGAFGRVQKIMHKKENKFYALKHLDYTTLVNKYKADKEVEMMKLINTFNHPNIVKLKFSYQQQIKEEDQPKTNLVLVLESGKCSVEDLLQINQQFDERQILYLMSGVIDALVMLETQGIVWSDVKPANLLFNENTNLILLCDFGLTYTLQLNPMQQCINDYEATVIRGTPAYMSPKLYQAFQQGKSVIHNPFHSDAYSLAITILNMMGLTIKEFSQHCRNISQIEIEQFIRNKFLKENKYTKIVDILISIINPPASEIFSFIRLKVQVQNYLLENNNTYLQPLITNINCSTKDNQGVEVNQNDQVYLISMSHINILQKNQENMKQSIKQFERMLNVYVKLFGEDSEQVASVYLQIGIIYYQMCKYKLALDNFEKAKQIRLKLNGDSTKHIAFVYNNVGLASLELQQYNKADEMFQKSAIIFEKELDQTNLLRTICFMGNLQLKKNQYQDALNTYLNCLQMESQEKKGVYQANINPLMYLNVGIVLSATGELLEAKEHFEKAYQLLIDHHVQQSYGDCYYVNQMHIVLKNLADIHWQTNKLLEALDYYERAKTHIIQYFGKENQRLTVIYYQIGAIYEELGKMQQAQEQFDKGSSIEQLSILE